MKVVFLVALALAIQGALGHTYFQAQLAGVKDNANATAVFEGMTHSGVMYYVLNVTDVVGLSSAKFVYGNASLSTETVVNYIQFDEPLDGTYSWEGEFQAANFTELYPITMQGFQANVGLGHIWAVLSNNASYGNTILSGQVQQKSGAELTDGAELADRADAASGYM